MILDHLNNAYLYYNMHPLFKKAFDYLSSNDFSKIENGTYELEGKDLLAIVNSYQTEPAEQRVWEGHRKYIDIQLVASGIENMGHAPLQEAKVLEAYVDEHDFTKFDATGSQVTVPANYFTIFYPTDVHKPNLIAEKPSQVKKVVMKVKLPEPLLQLTFASNNPHKLEEIRRKLHGTPISILSLQESGINEELPETGKTLEENAFQKANKVYSMFGLNCFADDTGLEVDALNGEPGVYSAMYAGEGASYQDNVNKLLHAMHGKANRKAKFRTMISLVLDAAEYRFEGVVHGYIIEKPRGVQGFGYDPVFVPSGYDQTFAEMDPDLKNKISHRGLAIEKLVKFLKEDVVN
jgi:XTP/dITP diphosphohydrolase